jgi:GNAT superfamily N-acetyltransferase
MQPREPASYLHAPAQNVTVPDHAAIAGVLDEHEASAAGALLARAFFDDPLTTHLFPDESQRARDAPEMFDVLARYDILFGAVDRLGDFDAVATWLMPGEIAETPEKLAQAGFDQLANKIGTAPLERLGAFYSVVEEAHMRAAPEPHWYLRLLGVDPGRQRRGLGGLLLAYGLARADESGRPCFLETFAERNVPFYLRHGFQLVLDEVEPNSGIRYWGFHRPALG